MRRKLKDLISFEAIRHIVYIPSMVLKMNNWYQFFMNYVGFKNESNVYKFRNGSKIKTNDAVDTETIAVIFIKKDYGIIKPNSTVIDIGGNIGVFSIYAGTTKNTKVYAYEPMPKTYKLLCQNIKLNKFDKNIIPFQLGVASKKETRRLYLGDNSVFNSMYFGKGKHVDIKCTTLKDIFDKNKIDVCDVLKIDCEGAEFEILYNAPKSYFKRIKEIRLEYHNQETKKDNIQDLIVFLEKQGFKLTIFRADNSYSGNAWFERK